MDRPIVERLIAAGLDDIYNTRRVAERPRAGGVERPARLEHTPPGGLP